MPGLAWHGEDSFELVVVPRIMAGHGWVWHGAAGRGEVRQGKGLFSIPF